MSATAKPAAAPAAPNYVVALGVIVTLDPKSKKTVEIGEGTAFSPADEEEAASLLKSGRIMTAEDYAAKVGGSNVTAAIDAANARAEAAEKELAELRAKQAPAA